MEHISYQKHPLKGQCRFCPEIHPKFSDLFRHEAIHRIQKEGTQLEVTREPGKQIIKKESDNANIIQIGTPKIESIRGANVQKDESLGSNLEGSLIPPSKNFGSKLPIQRRMDLRVQKSTHTNSRNSQVDLDKDIKERIRNYDRTKDFLKIITIGAKAIFKCKICSFRRVGLSKHHLLPHTFVHTGEQPFQCQICSKRFKNSQDRKRHQEIIHNGGRRYKCSNCSRNFTRHSHLSRHMKSHSSKIHPKNIQENKKNVQANKGVKNAILCLYRVEHVKEFAHFYSQALKRLHHSHPKGIQKEIGVTNEMDSDAEIEIKYPKLPYKCILCSEQFGEPMALYNHRKIHFSNSIGPRKDTSRKNQPEIPESSSNIQNPEIKSDEIALKLNPMDMTYQNESILVLSHFKKLGDGRFECLKCHQKVKHPREHYQIHLPSKYSTKLCPKKYPRMEKVQTVAEKATQKEKISESIREIESFTEEELQLYFQDIEQAINNAFN